MKTKIILLLTVATILNSCTFFMENYTRSNVMYVVNFTMPEYEKYVMKSAKYDSSVFNHLSFADGKVDRDTMVAIKDFDANSIYIPLHNDYYLVFSYEIIKSEDHVDDFLLYDVKWEDVKNSDKEIEEYDIISMSPLNLKKEVYPLKKHHTIWDFVEYLNDLIDDDELI